MTTYDAVRETLEGLGIDPDAIHPEAKVVGDLDMDSLEVAELTVSLEDKCGIELPDDAISGDPTVQDMADAIDKLKAQ